MTLTSRDSTRAIFRTPHTVSAVPLLPPFGVCWTLQDDISAETWIQKKLHKNGTMRQSYCTTQYLTTQLVGKTESSRHLLVKLQLWSSWQWHNYPCVRTCFGSRSFAVAAPITWNSLPLHIRNSSSIFGFRCQLKTFLYKLAFDPF